MGRIPNHDKEEEVRWHVLRFLSDLSFLNFSFGDFAFGSESYADRKKENIHRKNYSFYSFDELMKSIRTGKKMKPQGTVKTKQVTFFRHKD